MPSKITLPQMENQLSVKKQGDALLGGAAGRGNHPPSQKAVLLGDLTPIFDAAGILRRVGALPADGVLVIADGTGSHHVVGTAVKETGDGRRTDESARVNQNLSPTVAWVEHLVGLGRRLRKRFPTAIAIDVIVDHSSLGDKYVLKHVPATPSSRLRGEAVLRAAMATEVENGAISHRLSSTCDFSEVDHMMGSEGLKALTRGRGVKNVVISLSDTDYLASLVADRLAAARAHHRRGAQVGRDRDQLVVPGVVSVDSWLDFIATATYPRPGGQPKGDDAAPPGFIS